jgi:hypothetical protein
MLKIGTPDWLFEKKQVGKIIDRENGPIPLRNLNSTIAKKSSPRYYTFTKK